MNQGTLCQPFMAAVGYTFLVTPMGAIPVKAAPQLAYIYKDEVTHYLVHSTPNRVNVSGEKSSFAR